MDHLESALGTNAYAAFTHDHHAKVDGQQAEQEATVTMQRRNDLRALRVSGLPVCSQLPVASTCRQRRAKLC